MGARTDRSRKVLNAVFGIIERLDQDQDLDRALSEIAEGAAKATGAQNAAVILVSEGESALLAQATWGLPEEDARGLSFDWGEGIAGWVVEQGLPLCLGDAPADPRFVELPGQQTRVRGLCAVPLGRAGEVIGAITVAHEEPDAFDDDDLRVLSFLAYSIQKTLENARLYRLAVTDGLTGAFNRQYLNQTLAAEVERHRRYGQPLCVALVDVDHFKSVNDRFGHRVGDRALVWLVERLREAVRGVDPIVRFGGEEFLIVYPNTELVGAERVSERIRQVVAATPMQSPGGPIELTVSVGVAACAPGLDADTLIERADQALYRAKAAGRDQVVVAEP